MRLPRRENNPFLPEPAPRSGITYQDDTGNIAASRVDGERRARERGGAW